jgi:endo-1,4-beta-xylanase
MHLIYGHYDTIPTWLKNSQYTRDEYISLLEGYIHDVVTRYADRVDEWSIANEAPNRSFNPGSDFWNDKIGPEYIAIAFRAARQADPDGILIFNEDNNESPQDVYMTRTVETMVATVQQLKAEGVPIDVVGMQMHLFLPWDSQVRPDKAAVIATMQRFAALGVRIYITEFDVDLQRIPGTQAERWAYQAEIYGEMMAACLESGVCDSFATWGIDDPGSWLPNFVGEPNAEALMFDANFEPKPAYFAVRDALLGTTP